MSRKQENKTYKWLLTFPRVAGIDKSFQYKYLLEKEIKTYSKRVDFDKRTEKVVVAPRLSKDDVFPLYYNKAIKFIAFPLTMFGEFSKLSDIEYNKPKIINNQILYQDFQGTNEGKHDVALLYNKITKEIEVIDYEFGLYNIFYNYEAFMNVDLLNYIKPFFEEFGMDVKKVNLPMIRENRFSHLQTLLKENRFPYDFSIIYKSYIANYMYARTQEEYITKDTAFFQSNRDVLKIISPKKTDSESYKEAFIERYLKLSRFMKEFPYDSKWIPLDTTHTKLFEFTKPCPKGYMRDFFTGDCIPIPKDLTITVPTKLLETGKPVYPEHPLKWVTFIIRYLKNQYSNVAMLEPKSTYMPHPYEYTIQFNDQFTYPSKHVMSTRSAKTRMKMILPKEFDDFMENAISDTSVRFIMWMVNIKYEGTHSSPVIIDKDTFTIERVEVNAPFIEPMGATQQDDLDYQLEKLFKSYLPDFTYIPPLAICPYGLHRAEYVERTENVADIGGRCAEWTIYYLHLKLANEDIPMKLLSAYAFEELRKTGSIKHMITGYTTGLIRESTRRKSTPIIKAKPRSQISRVKSADYKSKTKKKTLKTV
jgi:hypothetical protein